MYDNPFIKQARYNTPNPRTIFQAEFYKFILNGESANKCRATSMCLRKDLDDIYYSKATISSLYVRTPLA